MNSVPEVIASYLADVTGQTPSAISTAVFELYARHTKKLVRVYKQQVNFS